MEMLKAHSEKLKEALMAANKAKDLEKAKKLVAEAQVPMPKFFLSDWCFSLFFLFFFFFFRSGRSLCPPPPGLTKGLRPPCG